MSFTYYSQEYQHIYHLSKKMFIYYYVIIVEKRKTGEHLAAKVVRKYSYIDISLGKSSKTLETYNVILGK
jgi:hypothetical protein